MTTGASVWDPTSPTPNITNDSSVVTESFVAVDHQHIFELTQFTYVVGAGALLVFLNGELLVPDVGFKERNTTSFDVIPVVSPDDEIIAVGFIGNIGNTDTESQLPPSPTDHLTDKRGKLLSTTHGVGYTYFNTATLNTRVWIGTAWQDQTVVIVGDPANNVPAAGVPITDLGNHYSGDEVEAALQEVGNSLNEVNTDIVTLEANLGSPTTGNGASMIGVEDAAGNFTGVNVEVVLAEIISTYASTANLDGASKVGIEDAAGNYTASGVEGALAEIAVLIQANTDSINAIDSVPPVGTILNLKTGVNPNLLYAGTVWVQYAEGAFLMNTVGGVDGAGGQNQLPLLEANLPSHVHPNTLLDPGHVHDVPDVGVRTGNGPTDDNSSAGADAIATVTTTSVETGITLTVDANPAHIGTPIDNRPMYLGVGIWERTS